MCLNWVSSDIVLYIWAQLFRFRLQAGNCKKAKDCICNTTTTWTIVASAFMTTIVAFNSIANANEPFSGTGSTRRIPSWSRSDPGPYFYCRRLHPSLVIETLMTGIHDSGEGFTEGAVVRAVRCIPGHFLKIHGQIVQCLNGHWEPETPTCHHVPETPRDQVNTIKYQTNRFPLEEAVPPKEPILPRRGITGISYRDMANCILLLGAFGLVFVFCLLSARYRSFVLRRLYVE